MHGLGLRVWRSQPVGRVPTVAASTPQHGALVCLFGLTNYTQTFLPIKPCATTRDLQDETSNYQALTYITEIVGNKSHLIDIFICYRGFWDLAFLIPNSTFNLFVDNIPLNKRRIFNI